MSNKVVLHYVPDYDVGKAEAGFGGRFTNAGYFSVQL